MSKEPALYELCARSGVPHDRCGKAGRRFVRRRSADLEALAALGTANGAEGLEIVGPEFVHRREPRVRAAAALWSPGSGRLEPERLVQVLQHRAESAGSILLRDARVAGSTQRADGTFEVRLERETIEARTVVNAAGLYADEVSALLGGETFRIYPVRGE